MEEGFLRRICESCGEQVSFYLYDSHEQTYRLGTLVTPVFMCLLNNFQSAQDSQVFVHGIERLFTFCKFPQMLDPTRKCLDPVAYRECYDNLRALLEQTVQGSGDFCFALIQDERGGFEYFCNKQGPYRACFDIYMAILSSIAQGNPYIVDERIKMALASDPSWVLFNKPDGTDSGEEIFENQLKQYILD